jgi:drug/metabolite transporter (DMT)-like permease
VTAVIGSEFAALAAVVAFFWFRERLNVRQLGGVGTIAVFVGVVSALRA